jgi:hypothetical protein
LNHHRDLSVLEPHGRARRENADRLDELACETVANLFALLEEKLA